MARDGGYVLIFLQKFYINLFVTYNLILMNSIWVTIATGVGSSILLSIFNIHRMSWTELFKQNVAKAVHEREMKRAKKIHSNGKTILQTFFLRDAKSRREKKTDKYLYTHIRMSIQMISVSFFSICNIHDGNTLCFMLCVCGIQHRQLTPIFFFLLPRVAKDIYEIL